MTKDELLAALQQATEGYWQLDKEIAVLEREKIGDCADDEVPAYTTSLDAALTLVPSDWDWAIEHDSAEYRASIGDPRLSYAYSAPTPALALAIASLKARA